MYLLLWDPETSLSASGVIQDDGEGACGRVFKNYPFFTAS